MIDIDAFLAGKPGIIFYAAHDGSPVLMTHFIGRKCQDTFMYRTMREGSKRQRYDKTSFFSLPGPHYHVPVEVAERYWPNYLKVRTSTDFQTFLSPMIRNHRLGPTLFLPDELRLYAGEQEAIILQGYYDFYLDEK